jgi:hypothetical protein
VIAAKQKPGQSAGFLFSVLRLCIGRSGPPQAAHHDHWHPEQERHVSLIGVWMADNVCVRPALRQNFVIGTRRSDRNL